MNYFMRHCQHSLVIPCLMKGRDSICWRLRLLWYESKNIPRSPHSTSLSCGWQRGLNRRLVGKTGPEGHLRREDASLGPNSRVALKRRPVTVKRVKVSYYGWGSMEHAKHCPACLHGGRPSLHYQERGACVSRGWRWLSRQRTRLIWNRSPCRWVPQVVCSLPFHIRC